MNVAAPAGFALHAKDHRIRSHPVADLDVADTFADGSDLAGELVAMTMGGSRRPVMPK